MSGPGYPDASLTISVREYDALILGSPPPPNPDSVENGSDPDELSNLVHRAHSEGIITVSVADCTPTEIRSEAARARAPLRRTILLARTELEAHAGRRAGVGRVVAIGPPARAASLQRAGADTILEFAHSLAVAPLPSALDHDKDLVSPSDGRTPALFLDYDGTLTPIQDRPEKAVLSSSTRQLLERLATQHTVVIVSGRDRLDVERLVGIPDLLYVGSHGFDVMGHMKDGRRVSHQIGEDHLPALGAAEQDLIAALTCITGVQIERKRFSLAAHYRMVPQNEEDALKEAFAAVASRHPKLRQSVGKKVMEMQPNIDWNKGQAVRLILERMDPGGLRVLPIYVGDDVTDEDAFFALRDQGAGIVVRTNARPTHSRYQLRDTQEVVRFLDRFTPECR